MTASQRIALARFLHSHDAEDVIDAAVCGYLTTSEACEIAEDFGVTLPEFRTALGLAITEGA